MLSASLQRCRRPAGGGAGCGWRRSSASTPSSRRSSGPSPRQEPPPDLLVNGTNDAWYGYSSGPYQFLAIVQLRAIEARRAVVRPAYAGVSARHPPHRRAGAGRASRWGRSIRTWQPGPGTSRRGCSWPACRGCGRATLYTSIGDLFAHACALFAAAALVVRSAGGRRRRRRAAREQPTGDLAMAAPTAERLADLARRLRVAPGVSLTSTGSATGSPRSRAWARTRASGPTTSGPRRC